MNFKILKKVFSIAMAFVLLLSLAACAPSYDEALKSSEDYASLHKAVKDASTDSELPTAYEALGKLIVNSKNNSIEIPFSVAYAEKDGDVCDFWMTTTLPEASLSLYVNNSNVLYVGTGSGADITWVKVDMDELENTFGDAPADANGSSINNENEALERFMKEKLGDDEGVSFMNSLLVSFDNTDDYTYHLEFNALTVKEFLKELLDATLASSEDVTVDVTLLESSELDSLSGTFVLNKYGRIKDLNVTAVLTVPEDESSLFGDLIPSFDMNFGISSDNGAGEKENTGESSADDLTVTTVSVQTSLQLVEKPDGYVVNAPANLDKAMTLEEYLFAMFSNMFGDLDVDYDITEGEFEETVPAGTSAE